MAFLNLMPQSVRDAFRAFYLRRELEQIDLNEIHFMKMQMDYQKEIDKGAVRRAAVTRELRGLA